MTDKPLTALHKAAREYASAGIPVFPVQPNGKAPAIAGNLDRATTDLCQIDAWWGSNAFNIGLEPERMGWAIVDIDIGGDKSTLPNTFTVVTPSGGEHRYYAGSIAASVRKLGPGLDTRGRRSYVLLPPSAVNGRPYSAPFFPPDDYDLAPLPEWIAQTAGQNTAAREAPPDVELDKPLAIDEARRYLARTEPPVEGDGSDDATYRAAARLKDYGISEATALDLLKQWSGFETEWLESKIANVYHYGQNEPGSDVPKSGAETFGAQAETLHRERIATSRFAGRWPDEYESLPELVFWDDEKTLPNYPDGGVAVLYGEWGSHKTNTTVTMMLDAIERGARVLYAAGEGAYGVGKHRIPAHCRKRGITTASLRSKLKIVPAVPLLASADDVAEFIDAQADFAPHIVVIDTLATAIAGEDENSSRAAAFLTANGPVGRIRDAFNALVLIPAHQGKDASKGVRGHSGFMGNVDVALRVSAHESGAIEVKVEKMRDGRDGFAIWFQAPPKGSVEVPVPVRISEIEYDKLAASENCAAGNSDRATRVEGILRQHGCFGFDRGRDNAWLAARLADLISGGPRPVDDSAARAWDTIRNTEREALKDASKFSARLGMTTAAWARRLTERGCYTNATENITLWCLPGGGSLGEGGGL